jgi:septal ring-binding cell division protein DamX
MKARLVGACLIIIAMASPALARNYYVVQNIKTHKCSVLPKKPKGKSVVVVSGSAPYKSRAEARAALRTLPACRVS